MLLDGIMVPLLDSCSMEGDSDNRYHTEISPQCGFEGPLSIDLDMDITYMDNACCFNSLDIKWRVLDAENFFYIPNAIGKGEQSMRDFHKANATPLISKTLDSHFKYSFACDYKRDTQNPELFDFRLTGKKAGAPGT